MSIDPAHLVGFTAGEGDVIQVFVDPDQRHAHIRFARIAEGERGRHLVEIVGAERHHVGERHRVVEIDEGIHARQLPPG